jgi:hypothetical protein
MRSGYSDFCQWSQDHNDVNSYAFIPYAAWPKNFTLLDTVIE